MANESEIVIHNNTIRCINTTSKEQYFSANKTDIRYERDRDDYFSFYNNVPITSEEDKDLNRLGVKEDFTNGGYKPYSYFNHATTINPDTGSLFSSADAMELFLGKNIGFFFNPDSVIHSELLSADVINTRNIIVSLQSMITELKINNKYLESITGDKITHKDIDN